MTFDAGADWPRYSLLPRGDTSPIASGNNGILYQHLDVMEVRL